jgi:hypothetical protein
VSVAIGGMPVRLAMDAVGALVRRTVAVGRQETRLLEVAVDAALQQGVEPGGFGFDLLDVTEFGAYRDAVLVGGIPGESELLGVVGFELYGHGDAFAWWLPLGNEKTRTPQGAGVPAR